LAAATVSLSKLQRSGIPLRIQDLAK